MPIETARKTRLPQLILTAVALSMGVVSIVLTILDPDASTNIFLGTGIAALALDRLSSLPVSSA